MTSDRQSPRFTRALHIVLVHGTGDRKAAWTLPGSRLRQIIGLNLSGTTFTVFEWSGKNSHAQRYRAAQDLRETIRRAADDHPDARIFILGHSHGGNVALYAMADIALRAKVQGIVTLSTPFMTAVQRNVYSLVRGVLSLLFPLVAVAFYPFFALLHLAMAGQVTLASVAMLGVPVGGYAAYTLGLELLSRLNIPMRISRNASALVNEPRGPSVKSIPVTSIWRASDEVYDIAQLLDALISVLYFLRRPLALAFVGILLIMLHEIGVLGTMPILPYIPYIGSFVEETLLAGNAHHFLAGGAVRLWAWLYSAFMWLWAGLVVTDIVALVLYRFAYGIDSAPLLLAPYIRMVVGLTPPNAQDVTFREVHTSVENRNHSPSDDDWISKRSSTRSPVLQIAFPRRLQPSSTVGQAPRPEPKGPRPQQASQLSRQTRL